MSNLAVRDDSIFSFGGGGHKMATSLDLTNPQNRVVMLNAMQNCDFRLTECQNIPISAVDYLAHEVDITGKESGEIVRCTRLVIIDADGATYECVSDTLLKSIQTVAFAYGPPPWNPPITLTVKMKQRNTRNIYWFEAKEQRPADPDDPTK